MCKQVFAYNFALAFIISICYGAFEHSPSSVIDVASGFVRINSNLDPSGIFNDPGSLILFNSPKVGISWGSYFSIPALKFNSATIAGVHKAGGVWGGGISLLGDELYKETNMIAAHGRIINDRIAISGSLSIMNVQIKKYGESSAVGVNVSWRLRINKSIEWCSVLQNINSPILFSEKNHIPQVIVSGISYQPEEQWKLVCEIEKDPLFNARFKFGGQFMIKPWLTFATGHATNPSQNTGGFIFRFRNYNFSYAFATHPDLDLSHFFGINIRIP